MILEKYTIYTANTLAENIATLINECLSQVDFNDPIVKLNVFYRAESMEAFKLFKKAFREIVITYNQPPHPVLNFIGQGPLQDRLAIEAVSVQCPNPSISYYNNSMASTALVVTEGQSNLYIGCSADTFDKALNVQVKKVLDKLKDTIAGYDFSISDIKRQWNYIEGITSNSENQQNYQVYNDGRSALFGLATWDNGYPAATGIGCKYKGLLVDTLAIKSGLVEKPIENPLQKNAHQYSKKVLVGEKASHTPKFERAKFLHDAHEGMLYVSGTAAIRGENTISNREISEQTRITLENIQELLDHAYIRQFENSTGTRRNCAIARVYLKYTKDFNAVKDVCLSFFGENILFVEADVCRDDLFIEIEAIYTYKK